MAQFKDYIQITRKRSNKLWKYIVYGLIVAVFIVILILSIILHLIKKQYSPQVSSLIYLTDIARLSEVVRNDSVIFIADGVHFVTGSVTILKLRNVTITSLTGNCSIYKSFSGNMFTIRDSDNIQVMNLTLYGQYKRHKYPGHILTFLDCSNVYVYNCSIYDFRQTGVLIYTKTIDTYQNNVIDSCYANSKSLYDEWVEYDGVINVKLQSNGFLISNCNNSTIKNSIAEYTTYYGSEMKNFGRNNTIENSISKICHLGFGSGSTTKYHQLDLKIRNVKAIDCLTGVVLSSDDGVQVQARVILSDTAKVKRANYILDLSASNAIVNIIIENQRGNASSFYGLMGRKGFNNVASIESVSIDSLYRNILQKHTKNITLYVDHSSVPEVFDSGLGNQVYGIRRHDDEKFIISTNKIRNSQQRRKAYRYTYELDSEDST
nr:polysaccharide lyase family 6-like protein [Oryctes rhinoceros nudivirus]